MDTLLGITDAINGVLWHDFVLYAILAVGVLFTFWTGFVQYQAMTHGITVVRGKYDRKDDPGAISHFQALSAALSATVGLGNIGGVAVAIALGGPGAVFWMWVVGFVGMALKATEVTLSNMYRNTDDPENPHGGPMYVAKIGFKKHFPRLAPVGAILGSIFCVTLLISSFTGGNMFQAWNVSVTTESYFNIPPIVTGVVLALLVGMVIIGGIKRIGSVAGKLVPGMCGLYLVASLYVVFTHLGSVPEVFRLIVGSAFSPLNAEGAFVGGTAGYAFLWGMKRALFSNEAGQGSAPIAHAAAKTEQPAREGIVAGMGPFIDTLVVCTLTAFVILVSGAWNREAEGTLTQMPTITMESVEPVDGGGIERVYALSDSELPENVRQGRWPTGENKVFLVVQGAMNEDTGTNLSRLNGTVEERDGGYLVKWSKLSIETSASSEPTQPKLEDQGVYTTYLGAALTSHAFDRILPGLGRWLVTIAAWLFAISTMISWSYYGEQGIVYLFGDRAVLPYKVLYCALIILACAGFITTDAALDSLTGFGTGIMLFANIPIMLIFSRETMREHHEYLRKLKAGEFPRED